MKIGIWGICGKMGRILCETIENYDDFEVAFGVDHKIEPIKNISIYEESGYIKNKADILIDFSNRSSTTRLISLSKWLERPLIICSTGQTTEDLSEIYAASKQIPIMLAHNTSLGAMYLTNVTEKGAKFFNKKDYEIDISETHSAQKKDIPSGTAIALLNAVLSSCPTLKTVYSCNGPREKDEISVTSKRIGDIVAEHEVSFVGCGEILTLKHEVLDRKVFALGALECAKFLIGKPAGLYKMEDMVKTEKCCNCNCIKNSLTKEEGNTTVTILDHQK